MARRAPVEGLPAKVLVLGNLQYQSESPIAITYPVVTFKS